MRNCADGFQMSILLIPLNGMRNERQYEKFKLQISGSNNARYRIENHPHNRVVVCCTVNGE